MFAMLVIIAGMGMAASFVYMWVISLLEMWLYKPVFVSGLGMHYLQWRDNVNSKMVGKIADSIFNLIRKIQQFICKHAVITAMPLLQKFLGKSWDFLLSKIKK